MMLTQIETKKVIRETICPAFVNAGFANPGISMWRWRENFVDVLHFYFGSNSDSFAIELGCHPRRISSPHPLPWQCFFRSRVHVPNQIGVTNGCIFSFTESKSELGEVLLRNTPHILDSSLVWWAQFTTIEKAVDLVINGSEDDLDAVMFPRKGSIMYQKSFVTLQGLTDPE